LCGVVEQVILSDAGSKNGRIIFAVNLNGIVGTESVDVLRGELKGSNGVVREVKR
jgi:hypothetical protein